MKGSHSPSWGFGRLLKEYSLRRWIAILRRLFVPENETNQQFLQLTYV
jgi:hypothetical protein